MKTEYSYGIIPFYKNNKGNIEILLIQNKSGKHRGFPKGHIDDGETPIQTAKRELFEETGLKIRYIDEKNIIEESYIDSSKQKSKGIIINKIVGYFIGYIESKEVKIQEHEILDFIRLSLEKAEDKITHKSTKEIFQKAKQTILNS